MNNEVNNTPTPLTEAELSEMREEAEAITPDIDDGRRYTRLLDEHAALKKVLQALEDFRGDGLSDIICDGGVSEEAGEDIDGELYDATEGARHLLAVRT